LVAAYNFISFCPMIAETLFKDFSMISYLKVSGLRHTATIMGYFTFDCIRSILYTLLFLYIVCKQSPAYHIMELGMPLMLEVINIVLLTYVVTFVCIKRLKNYRVVYFILMIIIFVIPYLMRKYGVDHSFIEFYILLLPYFSVQTTIKSYITSRLFNDEYSKSMKDMENAQYYQIASLMVLITLFTIQNIEFMPNVPSKVRKSYAKNITKLYKKKKALDDVSFIIPENSTVALLGPNGAGKTTFIKLLTREIMPDKGFIMLNGISSNSPEYETIFSHVISSYSSIYCIKTPFSITLSRLASI
jgi:ABC transporter